MSSISSDKSGARTIYVKGRDGKRRPVRLGKMSMKQARTAQTFIDDLERAHLSSVSPEPRTASWLAEIGDDLHDKLARAGLVQARDCTTLGAFFERYMGKREGVVKASTAIRMGQNQTRLLSFLKPDRPLSSITPGDAEDFRDHLLAQGYAEATVRRDCGYASAVFRYGIKHSIIARNPFEDVPTAAIGNDERQRYISEADAFKVLDELPDAAWRLLFALGRWGGLRTPSEPQRLTWGDVDWERRRLTIHSPKTEHHKGHAHRTIPLFGEIEGPLREVFEQAEDGTLHVLPFLQDRTGTALRKPLAKAIKAAGLEAWPRLWHNLRASRQTDLEQKFPSHVVCGWMGNSERIARAHYLQTTDADFAKAIGPDVESGDEQVVRQAVREGATNAANARQGEFGDNRQSAKFAQETLSAANAMTCQVGDTGLEPVTSRM